MSSKFIKKWEERNTGGIRAAIKPTTPLKSKIELAIRRIEAQIQYLNNSTNRLSERDKFLFSKVVEAYSKHQTKRAAVFANELAELRKMASFMMNSELALERVVLRLRTVTQLGNVVVTLAPASSVLQNIRTGVAGVLPSAERELEGVGMLLNDIMIEAGQTTGISPDIDVANDDARKILGEAAMVAEQRMKEKFPELPSIGQAEKSGEDFSTQF
jgi:division protein CdvB (Snf7/Vps24/ESCRT-III family)